MTDQQEEYGIEHNSPHDTRPEETSPKLYSKGIILVFSLLFSTIFSAVLMMSNLKTLGKKRARLQVLIFAILYMILTALTIQALELSPNYSFIGNVLGAAILNEYFWNKYIGADIAFERKSWIKPAVISLSVALVIFLLAMGSL